MVVVSPVVHHNSQGLTSSSTDEDINKYTVTIFFSSFFLNIGCSGFYICRI